MIQQADKYVSLSLWPCITFFFFSWKSLTYWNIKGGDWKRVSCHGNLNISGASAGNCKRLTAFSFFPRILCDTPKKSQDKNLNDCFFFSVSAKLFDWFCKICESINFRLVFHRPWKEKDYLHTCQFARVIRKFLGYRTNLLVVRLTKSPG